MTKFVHDVKSNRWVIVAPSRVSRPHDNLPSPPRSGDVSCPFEPENDAKNFEVFRIGDPWMVRVIKNKYPITSFHEVIIHSPSHERDIESLPIEHIELIIKTYRQRYNYHVSSGHGQVLIFCNHDIHAGASISHPHSQLVVVPSEVRLDTIPKEPEENVVATSSRFSVYCPNFSQWPYEVWLAPRSSESGVGVAPTFGEITDKEIAGLAELLPKILGFIVRKFSGPDIPYNYYIYHGKDWYLRIIPRLIHRAGLELGTGLSVNIVDPAQAAEEYKSGL